MDEPSEEFDLAEVVSAGHSVEECEEIVTNRADIMKCVTKEVCNRRVILSNNIEWLFIV